MAVIGSLVIQMAADVASLKSDLDRGRAELSAFGASTQKSMGAVSGAIGFAKKALVGLGIGFGVSTIRNFVNTNLAAVGGLGELAQQLGVSTDSLQAYQFAAKQSGVSQGELEAGIRKFTQTVGDAANGNKSAIEAFDNLGVKIRDAGGHLKTTDQLLPEVADALTKIAEPAKRASAEVDVFGRSGQKLDPILTGGAEGLGKWAQAASDAGVVIDKDLIASADKADDALTGLGDQFKAMGQGLVAELAPTIVDVVKVIGDIIKTLGEWMRSSDLVKEAMKLLGVVIVALIAGTGPFGLFITAITTLIAYWPQLSAAANTAWAAIKATAEPVITWLTAAIEQVRASIASVLEFINSVASTAQNVIARFQGGGAKTSGELISAGTKGGLSGLDMIGISSKSAQEQAAELQAVFANLSASLQAEALTLAGAVGDAFREMRGLTLAQAQAMADELVGHSIIPDMVDAVLGEFGRMQAGSDTAFAGVGENARSINTDMQGLTSTMKSLAQGFLDAATGATTWGDFAKQALEKVLDGVFDLLNAGSSGGGGGDFLSTLLGSLFGGGGGGLIPGGSGTDVFAFAGGGRPGVGMASLVGERGPELFVPDSAGTILPHHVSEALGRGSGGMLVNIDARGATRDAIPAMQAMIENLQAEQGRLRRDVGPMAISAVSRERQRSTAFANTFSGRPKR